jgi:hypothetical protein
MKIGFTPFNIYLLMAALALGAACKSPEERKQSKEASTLRVFLESNTDASARDRGVPVYRQNPVRVNVERAPLLTEVDLAVAEVVEMPGGFAIRAQFDGHGALVLEGATVAHKSKHLVIQSSFGETRWLAAPLITRRISNGELVFTPDATREESERIVRGLNNVVAKIKKKSSF